MALIYLLVAGLMEIASAALIVLGIIGLKLSTIWKS